MNDLPDAPWVRDAELNGMPQADDFVCPICGAEAPDEFYLIGGDVVGCSECVQRVDGWDYASEHMEECRE